MYTRHSYLAYLLKFSLTAFEDWRCRWPHWRYGWLIFCRLEFPHHDQTAGYRPYPVLLWRWPLYVCFVYILLKVQETKGRSLEEIEDLFIKSTVI